LSGCWYGISKLCGMLWKHEDFLCETKRHKPKKIL
jgi:hypothetical protein